MEHDYLQHCIEILKREPDHRISPSGGSFREHWIVHLIGIYGFRELREYGLLRYTGSTFDGYAVYDIEREED